MSLISLFSFLMSTSEDQKPVSVPEVVPMMSKIMEDKLTGQNYSEWSKTIRLYLRSIRMAIHLNKDPPTDDSKERWLEDDACLFLQIRNSIDGKVLTLINYCEYVKELMELTRRHTVSGQIHTHRACGRMRDCSGFGLLL